MSTSRKTKSELAAFYVLIVGCLITFGAVRTNQMLGDITTAMHSLTNPPAQPSQFAHTPHPSMIHLARR